MMEKEKLNTQGPLRKPPRATTVSPKSQQPEHEADKRIPQERMEMVRKTAHEASARHSMADKAKAVGRELDRLAGGEYERREDVAARRWAQGLKRKRS